MIIDILPKDVSIRVCKYTHSDTGVDFSAHCRAPISHLCLIGEARRLKVNIDYPLSKKASFWYTWEKWFEPSDLILAICDQYRNIYKEEALSLTECTSSPTIYNRGKSNGKWGIWGHVIEDLYLEKITIDTDTLEVNLSVGS